MLEICYQETTTLTLKYDSDFKEDFILIIYPQYNSIFFFLQSIHESFLRTVPSYSDQANVWMGLLKHYEWKSVVLLTSNDQDSRMIATRFTGLAAEYNIKV